MTLTFLQCVELAAAGRTVKEIIEDGGLRIEAMAAIEAVRNGKTAEDVRTFQERREKAIEDARFHRPLGCACGFLAYDKADLEEHTEATDDSGFEVVGYTVKADGEHPKVIKKKNGHRQVRVPLALMDKTGEKSRQRVRGVAIYYDGEGRRRSRVY